MKELSGVVTLLIATRNAHKVDEIRAILGKQFRFLTLQDFSGVPKVVEDAETFGGNATKKALQIVQWLTLHRPARSPQPDYVLADDSGLEVDALNGAPGVHSARFATEDSSNTANAPDADNNAKLLRLMKSLPAAKRTARFRCVIALVPTALTGTRHAPQLFGGVCEGRIARKPSGSAGFGYDPLFIPTGYRQSFADLSAAEKNALSHRSVALAKVKTALAPR